MTLTLANARLNLGLQRDDMDSTMREAALNEAVREIAKLRNWARMKTVATITLLAGQLSVGLPADFKEFVSSKTPVFEVVDDRLAPVTVFSRQQAQRQNWNTFPAASYYGWTSAARPTVPIMFYDWTGGSPKLYTPDVALADDTDLQISYYAYPATLTSSDTNFLLTNWPDMVVQRAKAILLSAINDDESDNAMKRFFSAYQVASMADAREQLAGITLRM